MIDLTTDEDNKDDASEQYCKKTSSLNGSNESRLPTSNSTVKKTRELPESVLTGHINIGSTISKIPNKYSIPITTNVRANGKYLHTYAELFKMFCVLYLVGYVNPQIAHRPLVGSQVS